MTDKKIEEAIKDAKSTGGAILILRRDLDALPRDEALDTAWRNNQRVIAMLRELLQEGCETCGDSKDDRSLQETNDPEVIEPCPACSQPPTVETHLKPTKNKCTQCFGHSAMMGSCKHCGGSGKEPMPTIKLETFELWFTMEGQHIIGHYDGREESLCRLVWEARQKEIDYLEAQNTRLTEELTHLKQSLGEDQ